MMAAGTVVEGMGMDKIPRVFLVIVDDSPEMPVALYYASRRAQRSGGRIAMLHVIGHEESHGLASVAALMRQEARQEAEQLMQRLASTVYDETGVIPIFYLKEGSARDELLALLTDDPSISILVLAAGTGPEGPGPLVSFLASKAMAKLRVPVTIVPGNLTHAQIDAIS
jgi:nucleotide-binding universal stress UspA family protein